MTSPSRTIPESLHEELVDLYGEVDPLTSKRRGYRELSTWLREKHHIEASREAVRLVVAPLLAERQELRREVLREKMEASLGKQLDALDDMIVRCRNKASGKIDAGNLSKLTNAMARVVLGKAALTIGQRHEVDARIDATLDGNVTVHDARTALAESLARLAGGAHPGAATGAPDEPAPGGGGDAPARLGGLGEG